MSRTRRCRGKHGWRSPLSVTDGVRLMDVDPVGEAPGTRAIDRIKGAIVNNLPRCRAEWWTKVGTCCLDTRWARVSRDGALTVSARRQAGAAHIGRATYEPSAGQLMLTMKDGTNLTMKAGMGVEQWEP
jgi:hypothetical protein